MKSMKSLRTVLLGVAIAAATLSSVAPASALGGCGFNRHRNAWGRCVWGGQNQNWCLRATGHGPWAVALLPVIAFGAARRSAADSKTQTDPLPGGDQTMF